MFATADILAIGIIEGPHAIGVPVAGRVSVVGFDDLDISAYITPGLTTVAQDIVGKATHAVDRLLDLAEGGNHHTEPLVLDVRLVVRNSTAPPRPTATSR